MTLMPRGAAKRDPSSKALIFERQPQKITGGVRRPSDDRVNQLKSIVTELVQDLAPQLGPNKTKSLLDRISKI